MPTAHKTMKINEIIGAQILAMARQGRSERAIVAALGPGAPSRATVRRYIDRMAAERRDAAPAKAPPRADAPPKAAPLPAAPVAPVDAARATPKDRQIDELLSNSLVWRRIRTAIATALANHPEAAAAVARALREVTL